jgi:DHA1 family bicyclomycin/chloramphenicol resistance-like MFS transporter
MILITRDSKFFPIILALFAALPPLAVNTYASAISLIAQDFGVQNSDVLTKFATYLLVFHLECSSGDPYLISTVGKM